MLALDLSYCNLARSQHQLRMDGKELRIPTHLRRAYVKDAGPDRYRKVVCLGGRRLGDVMRNTRHWAALRTFGLAFAIVLAPALMGQDDCEPPDPTTLADLQFRPFQMPGQELPEDIIAFESGVLVYEVELPDSVTQAMLVAEPAVESSAVSVQCIAGGTITGHPIDPALDWIPVDLPAGDSVLEVVVHPSGEHGT